MTPTAPYTPPPSQIPPILRRTRTPRPTTRPALAWLGFILAYILAPLALATIFLWLDSEAHATLDHSNTIYQQTFTQLP